jgi:hypothetical protein
MKFTLVNIGPNRSASTSLFTMLSKNKCAAGLRYKEIFNEVNFEEKIDRYITNFVGIRNNTTTLIDGTTSYYNHFYILYFLRVIDKDYIDEVKYIHILRNPLDRIKSLMNFKYYKDSVSDSWFNISYLKRYPGDKDIDEKAFFTYFMLHSNLYILKTAEFALGKQNIMIVKFDEIEKSKNRIYDFCRLPHDDIKIEHLNRSRDKFSIEVENLYDRFVNKAVLEFLDLERNFIHDEYGV